MGTLKNRESKRIRINSKEWENKDCTTRAKTNDSKGIFMVLIKDSFSKTVPMESFANWEKKL